MGRLKGIYRHAWSETQQRLFHAVAPIALLEGHRIPTMVSKGLPLTLCYYAKPPHRPMVDVDLIVPFARAREASALLVANGWSAEPFDWDDYLIFRHGMSHTHPVHGDLDLHWHVAHDCCTEAADNHFWSAAHPLTFKRTTTRRLCATDMLFHVILHGLRLNVEPPIRWVADAITILRSGEPIDWGRLVGFARQQRLSHRTGIGLRYLAERFGAGIPTEVLEQVEVRNVDAFERIETDRMFRDETDPIVWDVRMRYSMYRRIYLAYGRAGIYRTLTDGFRRRMQFIRSPGKS
jgi:hypothetical protein